MGLATLAFGSIPSWFKPSVIHICSRLWPSASWDCRRTVPGTSREVVVCGVRPRTLPRLKDSKLGSSWEFLLFGVS